MAVPPESLPLEVRPRQVEITVLLPTYNRAELLAQALPALLAQETGSCFAYEILVVDDGSSDHTAQVVAQAAQLAPHVPLRYSYQENRGRSAARNLGVRLARGRWLAFIDDDEVAAPFWLLHLWRTARQSGAWCVGGRVALLLSPAERAALGPRARRLLGETLSRPHTPASKDTLTSGNVLLKRSLLESLGGFDELLHRDQDTDLFWRLEKARVFMATAPEAVVFHCLPPARLEPGHLRDLARMQGVADAGMLLKYAGYPGLARALGKRLGVALLRDMLGLALGSMGGDGRLRLESLLGWWYAQGLVRGMLFWTMPRLFPQRRFLREVQIFSPQWGQDFGRLRETFLSAGRHV